MLSTSVGGVHIRGRSLGRPLEALTPLQSSSDWKCGMSKLEMSPEILDALQKLSALLEAEDAFERTLQIVVDLSVGTLPGCDASGITLRVKDTNATAAASDHYALGIDKIQYETGQGPCLSALESGEMQRIQSVSDEARWPEFCKRAESDGLRSSASFPLRVNGTVGALNLYAKTDHAFDNGTSEIAEVFAKQATIALENAAIHGAARKLGDQLNEALKSRDLIGQAKGILMEREGVSDEEAFDMLRMISQNSNIKLREVAQRLVQQRAKVGGGK